jgi:hypothetical protein
MNFADYQAAKELFEANAQKIINVLRQHGVFPGYSSNQYFRFRTFNKTNPQAPFLPAGENSIYMIFDVNVADYSEGHSLVIDTSWLENFDATVVANYAEQLVRQRTEAEQAERAACEQRRIESERKQLLELQAKHPDLVK